MSDRKQAEVLDWRRIAVNELDVEGEEEVTRRSTKGVVSCPEWARWSFSLP